MQSIQVRTRSLGFCLHRLTPFLGEGESVSVPGIISVLRFFEFINATVNRLTTSATFLTKRSQITPSKSSSLVNLTKQLNMAVSRNGGSNIRDMAREKFGSKVTLSQSDHIHVEYLSGPMKYLSNHWRFIREPDGSCTIDFYVDFEFKSALFQSLIEVFFNKAVTKMVEAFEARAEELYGAGKL